MYAQLSKPKSATLQSPNQNQGNTIKASPLSMTMSATSPAMQPVTRQSYTETDDSPSDVNLPPPPKKQLPANPHDSG